MQNWFHAHPFVTYFLILGLTIYIFNAVFRVGRLPILKEILVHLVMAAGSWVLWLLQYDKLPIIQCMSVAVIMMLMLRGRQLYDKWKTKGKSRETAADPGGKANG
ncbi:YlaH-like family protein [Paenibacillus sp. sptzw28]|uniref:YlaH-like family protein n=1 Tax=Paenibacillus sp. sptzw28 TaxID=715179 RepID=UPI001C6DF0CF|nr:YlaH-like family protein [Paenibacillus sp. sptzw28]QYR20110.1 YlaH-like family protein [Paenibacillus sp. sptzw28]